MYLLSMMTLPLRLAQFVFLCVDPISLRSAFFQQPTKKQRNCGNENYISRGQRAARFRKSYEIVKVTKS